MNIDIKYKNDKIINTILENHFKEFKDTMWNKVGKDMREQIESTVEKALNCGNIERGYIKHKCLDCGEKYIQGFTCKSKFCTKCGRKYFYQKRELLKNLCPNLYVQIVVVNLNIKKLTTIKCQLR